MKSMLMANTIRLKQDKFFLLFVVFFALLGLWFPLLYTRDAKVYGDSYTFDTGLYLFSLFLTFGIALFSVLFLGKEYEDGTIRNKIIGGKKRSSIYFSALITLSITMVIMALFYVAAYSILGAALLEPSKLSIKELLALMAASIMALLAIVSICTAIVMNTRNRTIAMVVVIVVVTALFALGVSTVARLQQPETISNYMAINEDGVMEEGTPYENPKFLRGGLREFYEYMACLLPGGQYIMIISEEVELWLRIVILSSLTIVVSTAIGITLFNRKDIN